MDIELKDFLVMMMMLSWQLRRSHYYLNEKMKSYQPIHWPNNNVAELTKRRFARIPKKKNLGNVV